MDRSLRVATHGLGTDVLPELLGKVFHVTTYAGLQGIRQSGAIRVVKESTHPSIMRYPNALFRSIDHVSLCDLRNVSDADLRTALDAYYFLNPDSENSDPVFLILSPSFLGPLIPWSSELCRRYPDKLIVPYIESGHPDPVPLSSVEDILSVTLT